MKTYIHVNQHVIKSNINKDKKDLPLTAKTYKDNIKSHGFHIIDDLGNIVATFRYELEHPLECGAHVWCETTLKVVSL